MNAFKRILPVGLLVLSNLLLLAQNVNHSTAVIKERLDSSIQFSKFEKIEYLYNASGHNSSAVTYEWSTTSNKFEESLKTEFTYNQKGHCILSQQTKWDPTSSQWLPASYSDLSYDDKEQLLSMNFFKWNALLNNWELSTKTDCVNRYNSNGTVRSIISNVFTKALNKTARSKYDYTYNSNGTILSVFHYDMNVDTIRPVDKDEYTYDPDGNLTTRTNFRYHNRIWYLIGTDDFTFNTLNAGNQLLTPQEYVVPSLMLPVDYYFGCMITSQTHTVGSNIWTKVYYYSSHDVTAVKELQTFNTAVFPNPAADCLNIQWDGNQVLLKIELFDDSGKKVFTGSVVNHSKLSIQAYPKGLYLVKLSDNHQILKTEKVYFY